MGARKVRIEACSACQLRCPRCPTGLGELGPVVGTGILRAQDFEAFLERNPDVREVELSNWGEIFLNPQLSEILRIGYERGVALAARNGVNLNGAGEQVLEDLVRYRVRSLVLSLDGASQETYATYRVRGDLERVLAHVRTINEHKRRYRSSLPLLTWKMIVFGHNQHELELARARATRLGMLFYPDVNWDPSYSPIEVPESVRAETGLSAVSMDEVERRTGSRFSKNFCLQLWNEPQVNWDGRILGCCINTWGEFGGDAFRDGRERALEGPGLRHAQRMLMGRAAPLEGLPCTTCEQYRAMAAAGAWVRPADIRRDRRRKRLREGVLRLANLPLFKRFALPLVGRAAARARFR